MDCKGQNSKIGTDGTCIPCLGTTFPNPTDPYECIKNSCTNTQRVAENDECEECPEFQVQDVLFESRCVPL